MPTAANSCHMGQSYTVDYELSDDDEHVHHVWDNGIEPTLTVDPARKRRRWRVSGGTAGSTALRSKVLIQGQRSVCVSA